MPLTPQDYKVWVFMKKAGIKSFNVKYDEGDGKYNIISIELDSIKYSSKQEIKMSEEELLRLLKAAVFDTFECGRCGSPLESDAEYCGLCEWKNPLSNII